MSQATDQFATVVASIPHHDLFRGMWSGRVTQLSDHHLRDCPHCGRQLPVTAEAVTLTMIALCSREWLKSAGPLCAIGLTELKDLEVATTFGEAIV